MAKQHGYWDKNGNFHETDTYEEAVDKWRVDQGYSSGGVYDMGGGKVVDTREAASKRTGGGATEAALMPDAPSSLSRDVLLEGSGFDYDAHSPLSRKTQEDIFLSRMGKTEEELGLALGGPESYTREGKVYRTTQSDDDFVGDAKQIVAQYRESQALGQARVPSSSLLQRKVGDRLYANVTGYDEEGRPTFGMTTEDTGIPLYFVPGGIDPTSGHESPSSLTPNATEAGAIPAIVGLSLRGVSRFPSGEEILQISSQLDQGRRRLDLQAEQSESLRLANEAYRRRQQVTMDYLAGKEEELREKLTEAPIQASISDAAELREIQNRQTAIRTELDGFTAAYITAMEGDPTLVSFSDTMSTVESAAAWIDQTTKGVIGHIARNNPIVAGGLNMALGLPTSAIAGMYSFGMGALKGAQVKLLQTLGLERTILGAGATKVGDVLVESPHALFRMVGNMLQTRSLDEKAEAAAEHLLQTQRWIDEVDEYWTTTVQMVQLATGGKEPTLQNLWRGLSNPVNTASPMLELTDEDWLELPDDVRKTYEADSASWRNPELALRLGEAREQMRARSNEIIVEAVDYYKETEDYDGTLEMMKQAVRLDVNAAPAFNRYFAYTWLSEPETEEGFINAVAEVMLQKGERLTNSELYHIQQRFVNPTKEIVGEVVVGIVLVAPDKAWDVLMEGTIGVVKAVGGAGMEILKAVPVTGNAIDYLTRRSMRSVGHQIQHSTTNALRTVVGTGQAPRTIGENSLQSVMHAAGTAIARNPDELPKVIPIIGETGVAALRLAGNIVNNVDLETVRPALRKLVQSVAPQNWGELVQHVYDDLFDLTKKRVMNELASEVAAGRLTQQAALDQAAVAARVAANNPNNIAPAMGTIFKMAHQAANTPRIVSAASGIMNDSAIWIAMSKLGWEKYLADGYFPVRAMNAMRELWTAAVLPLRFGWTVINGTDSFFRYAIEGGSIYDDLGFILSTNYERAFESGIIPEELVQAFGREELGLGAGVAHQLIQGERPSFGFATYIANEWKRLGDVAPPRANMFGKTWDFMARGFNSVAGGMKDTNAHIEFTLRLRLFNKHFIENFNLTERIALNRWRQVVESSNLPIEQKNAMFDLWRRVGDKPAQMQAIVGQALGDEGASAVYNMFSPENLDNLLKGLSPSERHNIAQAINEKIAGIFEEAARRGRPPKAEEIQGLFRQIRESMQKELHDVMSDPGRHTIREIRENLAGTPNTDPIPLGTASPGATRNPRKVVDVEQVQPTREALVRLSERETVGDVDEFVQNFSDAVKPFSGFKVDPELEVTSRAVFDETTGRATIIVHPDLLEKSGTEVASTLRENVIDSLMFRDRLHLADEFKDIADFRAPLKEFLDDPIAFSAKNPEQYHFIARQMDAFPGHARVFEALSPAEITYRGLVPAGIPIDVIGPHTSAGRKTLNLSEEALQGFEGVPSVPSREYLRSGDAWARSWGKARSLSNELFAARQAATGELAAEIGQRAALVSETIAHVDELHTRITNFFLNYFPGPVRRPYGAGRAGAWNKYYDLFTKIYNAGAGLGDELVGRAGKMSLEELTAMRNISPAEFLARAGIILDPDNVRLTIKGGLMQGTTNVKVHLVGLFDHLKITAWEDLFRPWNEIITQGRRIDPHERVGDAVREVVEAVQKEVESVVDEAGEVVQKTFVEESETINTFSRATLRQRAIETWGMVEDEADAVVALIDADAGYYATIAGASRSDYYARYWGDIITGGKPAKDALFQTIPDSELLRAASALQENPDKFQEFLRGWLSDPEVREAYTSTPIGKALLNWTGGGASDVQKRQVIEAILDSANAQEASRIRQEAKAYLDVLFPDEEFVTVYRSALSIDGVGSFAHGSFSMDAAKKFQGPLYEIRVPKSDIFATYQSHPSLYTLGEGEVWLDEVGFGRAELLSVNGGEPPDFMLRAFDLEKSRNLSQTLFQEVGGLRKGSFEIMADGRALVRGLGSQDVSTFVHESVHVFEHALQDLAAQGNDIAKADLERLADHMIAKGLNLDDAGRWSVEMKEYLARAKERYLRDGIAPTPQLEPIFKRYKKWLTDIYQKLTGTPLYGLKVQGTPIQEFFDEVLTKGSELQEIVDPSEFVLHAPLSQAPLSTSMGAISEAQLMKQEVGTAGRRVFGTDPSGSMVVTGTPTTHPEWYLKIYNGDTALGIAADKKAGLGGRIQESLDRLITGEAPQNALDEKVRTVLLDNLGGDRPGFINIEWMMATNQWDKARQGVADMGYESLEAYNNDLFDGLLDLTGSEAEHLSVGDIIRTKLTTEIEDPLLAEAVRMEARHMIEDVVAGRSMLWMPGTPEARLKLGQAWIEDLEKIIRGEPIDNPQLRDALAQNLENGVLEGMTLKRPAHPYLADAVGKSPEEVERLRSIYNDMVDTPDDIDSYLQARSMSSDYQRHAEEMWTAFLRSYGLELWGEEVTRSPESFRLFLEAHIEDLRAQGFEQTAPESLEALHIMLQNIDDYRNLTHTYGHLIGLEPAPIKIAGQLPRPMPEWAMPRYFRKWLEHQTSEMGKVNRVLEALDEWERYIVDGMKDESLFVTLGGIPQDKADLIRDLVEQGTTLKTQAIDAAINGDPNLIFPELSKGLADLRWGHKGLAGAVEQTNFSMLDYTDFSNFDNIMRNVVPFWMFPSRSIPYWIETLALNPEIIMAYERYMRLSERMAYKMGATMSNGEPLPSLEGYIPIPGTKIWVNLTAPFSAKYVLEGIRTLTGGGRDYYIDDESIREMPILSRLSAHMFEFARLFGFSPGPWITIPLYGIDHFFNNGELAHQFPPFSVIPQIDLIPIWSQRDMLAGMRRTFGPKFPETLSPQVSWKDYLVEREVLSIALQRLEDANTEADREQIIAEIKSALGYRRVQDAVDSNGRRIPHPTGFELMPRTDDPLWVQARQSVEERDLFTDWTGYFTGIYPKQYTDGQAMLFDLRDEINALRDSINNEMRADIFGFYMDAEERYDSYIDQRYNTPEGWIRNLYGAIGWVRGPQGEELKGMDRQYAIAMQINQDVLTDEFFVQMARYAEEKDQALQRVPVGDLDGRGRVWDNYFRKTGLLKANPLYQDAQTFYTVGYKPDTMIEENFRNDFMYLLHTTQPRWDKEGGQSYTDYMKEVAQWQSEIPFIAERLRTTFLNQEVLPKLLGSQAPNRIINGRPEIAITDDRIVDTGKLIDNILQNISYADVLEWRKLRDTPLDAANEAWKELAWNPFWEIVNIEENRFRQEQKTQEFLDQWNKPSMDDIVAHVQVNYPGRWTDEEIIHYLKGGVSTVEDRLSPETEANRKEDAIWEVILAAGPNSAELRDKLDALTPYGSDKMTTWYDTHGNSASWGDPTSFDLFYDSMMKAASELDLHKPTASQLTEWAGVKDLDTAFDASVRSRFGDTFIHEVMRPYWDLDAIFDKKEREAYREDNPQVEQYQTYEEAYAIDNPLWAKYYKPYLYEKIQEGELSSDSILSGGKGGASGKSGGGGGGGRARARQTAVNAQGQAESMYLPLGYRRALDPMALESTRLGQGGVAGKPYWPAGFAELAGATAADHIKNLIDEAIKLLPVTEEYLLGIAERHPEFAEYITQLIEMSNSL